MEAQQKIIAQDMIECKDLLGKWAYLYKDQAREYLMFRMYNLSCLFKEKTFEYINKNIIRNTKCEDIIDLNDLPIGIKKNLRIEVKE